MRYKLTAGGWLQRLSDSAFVNPETNAEYLSWLADGNTPEPANVPSAAEIAQSVIGNEETIHKISQRFLREQALLLGIQGGIITTAMLDYTTPLDTAAASWTSLNYGAQLCVLQERLCRQQRAIIKAAGG